MQKSRLVNETMLKRKSATGVFEHLANQVLRIVALDVGEEGVQ